VDVAPDEHAWWQRGVVYQIYPRSYQDSNGDGIGDLAGITSRLDHLAWLGVDAVWLSPIFESPMEDGGYDITDYTAVDPRFGDLATAETLIEQAHRRGLRVVLDFVPNHTSHQHPWFREARQGRDNARRNWYIWRDPGPDGGPPNNWVSATDVMRPGSGWWLDQASGQYFLGTFSSVQPDLNWANPLVREAMLDVLRFWLDRGVDGFRVDMVGFLAKDPQFRDEPPVPEGGNVFAATQYQWNQPENLDYLREMRAVVDAYSDRVLIGEMSYGSPLEQLVSFASEAGIDLPTNFGLITLPFEPEKIAEHVDAYDAAVLQGGAWPNYCLGNHDMPRISAQGEARARLATLLLLSVRGTPFLYYGDEIGMSNVDIPPERRDDRWDVPQHDLTRDSARTPMQWNADPNAGFCPPDVEPWLPIADDYERINVAVEREDGDSMLALVRTLLALRRQMPALAVGSYRRLTDVPQGCVAYIRGSGAQRIAAVLNFRDGAITVDEPELRAGRLLVGTRPGRAPGSEPPARLEACEGVLLELA